MFKGKFCFGIKSTLQTSSSVQNRWLIESFASRAALLGFIYLCVNIIYQLGYLSELGIEFGFFAILKSLPVLENFLIAAYAFLVWGFLVEMSESTYDQFFAFFKSKSWRDNKIRETRIMLMIALCILYGSLQFWYQTRSEWDIDYFISWSKYLKPQVFLAMIQPTWDFLTWPYTVLVVVLLILYFVYSNGLYRSYRRNGINQLMQSTRRKMEFHINAVTPAGMIIVCIFFLLIIPGELGRLTAGQTIRRVQGTETQRIVRIELNDVTTFCGEKLRVRNNDQIWAYSIGKNPIYHLGHLGENEIFAKFDNASANGSYNICLVSTSSIKTIVFPSRAISE